MTVTLYGEKDLLSVMKKLLMGRFSWIICVGLKGDYRYSARRRQRGISDSRGEDGDWNEVATSQGMSAATRSWTRQGMGLAQTSDTGFGRLASRMVRGSVYVVLGHCIGDKVL